MNRRAASPADDLAREEIHDHREIEPAFPRPKVRDVSDPHPVWARDRELALQQIRNQDGRLADGPTPGAIPVQGTQPVLPHEAGHPVLAAGLARLSEIQEHAWCAVDALARDERRSDQPQQPGVLVSPPRQGLLERRVVPARRHVEYTAQRLHAVLSE